MKISTEYMVSKIHKEMTGAILEFVRQEYTGPDNQKWMVMVDGCPDWHPPPAVKGHRPDLYIQSKYSKVTIIGEAKTENDLMTPRSKNQIGGFIDYLVEREGQSIFILCVALNQVSNARYLIRSNEPVKRITTHLIDRSKYDHLHA